MSDRFLFVYDPKTNYDNTIILVVDRGPETVEGAEMRGGHLRGDKQGYVVAVCDHEDHARRIVAALDATPGDTKVDPDEEPF